MGKPEETPRTAKCSIPRWSAAWSAASVRSSQVRDSVPGSAPGLRAGGQVGDQEWMEWREVAFQARPRVPGLQSAAEDQQGCRRR